mmetsp:Transcript_11582/g.13726  ORF Transcript_11582/g.13726 Transcript_11582/m.13726 type:complete len:410 (-) Transcript_11582:4065-5294(-)
MTSIQSRVRIPLPESSADHHPICLGGRSSLHHIPINHNLQSVRRSRHNLKQLPVLLTWNLSRLPRVRGTVVQSIGQRVRPHAGPGVVRLLINHIILVRLTARRVVTGEIVRHRDGARVPEPSPEAVILVRISRESCELVRSPWHVQSALSSVGELIRDHRRGDRSIGGARGIDIHFHVHIFEPPVAQEDRGRVHCRVGVHVGVTMVHRDGLRREPVWQRQVHDRLRRVTPREGVNIEGECFLGEHNIHTLLVHISIANQRRRVHRQDHRVPSFANLARVSQRQVALVLERGRGSSGQHPHIIQVRLVVAGTTKDVQVSVVDLRSVLKPADVIGDRDVGLCLVPWSWGAHQVTDQISHAGAGQSVRVIPGHAEGQHHRVHVVLCRERDVSRRGSHHVLKVVRLIRDGKLS